MAEIEEKHNLVGKSPKERPTVDAIRAKFQAFFYLSSSTHIEARDARHILIRFSLENNCEQVLVKNQVMIVDKLVRFAR